MNIHATKNRSNTPEAWRKRLQRATDYLVAHLDAPLDLERLAEQAHFSPYHFHRVYTALMGERVAETVRRMRLDRAAVQLISTASDISSIAKKAGYASVQAFSRAFREAYAVAPGKYRSYTQTAFAKTQNMTRTVNMAPCHQDHFLHHVEVVQAVPQRVVALRHSGSYLEIGNSFQKLTAWAAGRGLLNVQTLMYGIYYDDTDSKHISDLQSEACISVPDAFVLTEAEPDMQVISTVTGRCARLVFTGPYGELHTAYTWLYKYWLPQSGEEPGTQPPQETYLNDPRTTAVVDLQTAIDIPLMDSCG